MRKKKGIRGKISEQEEERLIIRYLVSSISAQASAHGRVIQPDEAVQELRRLLSEAAARMFDAPNWEALVAAGMEIYPEEALRDAHHYAVELYYDTHFGKRTVMGAPRHSALHLLWLAARKWEKSYKEIADKVGLPTETLDERMASIDRVVKQVQAARDRFPHLTPPTERKKGR